MKFIKSIKRNYKYSLNYIRNMIVYFYYHFQLKPKHIGNKGIYYIDIKSNIYRRHLANLVFWLTNYGCIVYYKHSFKSIGSISTVTKNIIKEKNFRICFIKPENYDVRFADKESEKLDKTIFFDRNYGDPKANNSWSIPLGLFPPTYYSGLYQNLKKLRNKSKRTINIFFSGNLDEKLYDRSSIRTNFNKLTRLQIIRLLEIKLSKDIILYPKKLSDFDLKDFMNKIVINDIQKIMIPQEKYFDLLSKSDFYLFTPGVGHPICHNNFESMAIGTIPILEYPEYFHPNLEHKKNCLVFNGENELLNIIEEAQSIDLIEIEKLRNNVIKYYDEHLDPIKIAKKIITYKPDKYDKIYFGLD